MYITSTNILVSELAHSCSESFNYYCLYIWLCNCFYFQDSLNSYCLPHTHTHTHARTHACTHACTHTHTRYVVGTVFGFEHLLLVVAVWLQWAIKPEPKWVRLAVARREYLARERRRGEYKEEEEGKQITEEERDKDD